MSASELEAQWNSKMVTRSNTIVFTFDPASPRITEYDLHEWLHEEMCIQEQKVQMIQIDGIKRQMYVRLTEKDYMLSIINSTGGVGHTHFIPGKYPAWR